MGSVPLVVRVGALCFFAPVACIYYTAAVFSSSLLFLSMEMKTQSRVCERCCLLRTVLRVVGRLVVSPRLSVRGSPRPSSLFLLRRRGAVSVIIGSSRIAACLSCPSPRSAWAGGAVCSLAWWGASFLLVALSYCFASSRCHSFLFFLFPFARPPHAGSLLLAGFN